MKKYPIHEDPTTLSLELNEGASAMARLVAIDSPENFYIKTPITIWPLKNGKGWWAEHDDGEGMALSKENYIKLMHLPSEEKVREWWYETF